MARLVARLQRLGIGETDWVECNVKTELYFRSAARHTSLKDQGRVFYTELFTAVTSPAFTAVTYLLKFTRRA